MRSGRDLSRVAETAPNLCLGVEGPPLPHLEQLGAQLIVILYVECQILEQLEQWRIACPENRVKHNLKENLLGNYYWEISSRVDPGWRLVDRILRRRQANLFGSSC
jgi:hypothetical protein